MTYRVAPIVLLLTASTVTAGRPLSPAPSSSPLTVHEWGTFTSVAGEDGRAQEWLPRQAPGELPCFVERLPLNVKGYLPGTVRMETPVLYFYSPVATAVDVKVRFRNGVITEWYPRARVEPRFSSFQPTVGRSSRGRFLVRAHRLPQGDRRPSRPSRVRATITRRAPPMRPRCSVGEQNEKFLFYRGVGLFAPPIEARVEASGGVTVPDVLGRAARGCGVVRQ